MVNTCVLSINAVGNCEIIIDVKEVYWSALGLTPDCWRAQIPDVTSGVSCEIIGRGGSQTALGQTHVLPGSTLRDTCIQSIISRTLLTKEQKVSLRLNTWLPRCTDNHRIRTIGPLLTESSYNTSTSGRFAFDKQLKKFTIMKLIKSFWSI